jgi:hypothetical protein
MYLVGDRLLLSVTGRESNWYGNMRMEALLVWTEFVGYPRHTKSPSKEGLVIKFGRLDNVNSILDIRGSV